MYMNLNNWIQSFIQSYDFSLSLEEDRILFLKIYISFFYHNHANQVGDSSETVFIFTYING